MKDEVAYLFLFRLHGTVSMDLGSVSPKSQPTKSIVTLTLGGPSSVSKVGCRETVSGMTD
jgi:hypothetical protein